MSFRVYPYTADNGDTYRIRLDEDTAAAGGFTGVADARDLFVKVSKSNREFGMRPRGIRASRVSNNRVTYRLIPMATQSDLNSAASSQTITVGSATWTVVSVANEDV